MRKLIWTAAALVLVACSSNTGTRTTATYRPAPAAPPPTYYRQPAYAPQAPYNPQAAKPQPAAPRYPSPVAAPVPPSASNPAPAPAYAGAFRWNTRFSDAQAEARASRRLILVGTTKPGCSLCEKFKNQIVPQSASQIGGTVVGYMLDTSNQDAPEVWQLLKTNLPTARLMPLVGIITPDLRWVTGFGGPADQGQLLSAIATARRVQPAAAVGTPRETDERTALHRHAGSGRDPGIYEWTPLSDVADETGEIPFPEDALTGDPVLASAGDEEVLLPPVPEAAPARTSTSTWTSLPELPDGVLAAPAPIDLAAALAPAAEPVRLAPAKRPEVTAQRPDVTAQRPDLTAKRPDGPAQPADTTAKPAAIDEAAGRAALEAVLRLVEAGDHDGARQALARAGARYGASDALAREISRGSVALYNARQIQAAEGPARLRLKDAARRNMGDSLWASLFR